VLAEVVAAGFTLVGTFLPWGEANVAFIGRVTIDGTGGGYHATWIRYLAPLAAFIAASSLRGPGVWLRSFAVVLVSLLMFYWSIDDARRLYDIEQRLDGSLAGRFVTPSVGAGLILTTAGTGFVLICGVAGVIAEIVKSQRRNQAG
jgi:hypothetical protein